jgi:hypothetical protein
MPGGLRSCPQERITVSVMINGSSCQYSSMDRASAVTVYQSRLDKRLSIYFQVIQSTQVKLNRQKNQKISLQGRHRTPGIDELYK